MCNLCTKFVKFLEIGKQISEDLVTEGGNVHRPAPVPRFSDRSARRYRDTSLRAHARIHYIVCVFCLHAFTRGSKSQKNSGLRVKASDSFSFTAFTNFAFTDNSLILNGLHPSVKAVKAKNTTFM